ncbi:MAG TPA: dihydrolipoamide acetyltransferase family protein [Xanthobacteraceae bacterium]|nr:dihydrolipoamide acetyltransferase family protein [Xanthobacteraceae bacterium]
MRHVIAMPALSDTMNNGRLVKWIKAVGDPVRKGETIAEVETDKAVMEVEAFHDGYLSGPLAAEGSEMPVGEPIGYIAESRAESDQAMPAAAAPAQARARAPAAVAAGQPAAPARTRAGAAHGDGIRASPYARRMARELGVDVAELGSSAGAVRADAVLDAAQRAATHQSAPSSLSWPEAGPPYRIVRPTSLRDAMARHMIASVATPTFRVTAQLALEALKQTADRRQISLTLLLARACAQTVLTMPFFNAAYTPDGLAMRERVDIGIAVDTPDGLVAPVLRDVAQRPMEVLAADWRALRDRVERRRLVPADYEGATFYLSNLGTFPVVQSFDAVLPRGATGILCVAAAHGEHTLVTLVCDHRVVAGADAARFLARLSDAVAGLATRAAESPIGGSTP